MRSASMCKRYEPIIIYYAACYVQCTLYIELDCWSGQNFWSYRTHHIHHSELNRSGTSPLITAIPVYLDSDTSFLSTSVIWGIIIRLVLLSLTINLVYVKDNRPPGERKREIEAFALALNAKRYKFTLEIGEKLLILLAECLSTI